MRTPFAVRRPLGVVTMLALVTAACGGSDATEPEEPVLNQAAGMQIASRLMAEVISVGFSALGGASPSGSASAVASGALVPITQTVPCQGGGSITVTGNFTNTLGNTGTGKVTYNLKQVPNGCVIATSQGAFTVDGNPDFTIAGDLSVTGWTLGLFHFTYGGGFRWTGSGGSGSCSIDLTYEFNYATSTVNGSGHMCGYNISFNQTV